MYLCLHSHVTPQYGRRELRRNHPIRQKQSPGMKHFDSLGGSDNGSPGSSVNVGMTPSQLLGDVNNQRRMSSLLGGPTIVTDDFGNLEAYKSFNSPKKLSPSSTQSGRSRHSENQSQRRMILSRSPLISERSSTAQLFNTDDNGDFNAISPTINRSNKYAPSVINRSQGSLTDAASTVDTPLQNMLVLRRGSSTPRQRLPDAINTPQQSMQMLRHGGTDHNGIPLYSPPPPPLRRVSGQGFVSPKQTPQMRLNTL